MSFDTTTAAAAVVGIQQANYQMQLGVTMLKQQAESNQAVANALISSAAQSVYNAQGRAVTPPGQLINGRG